MSYCSLLEGSGSIQLLLTSQLVYLRWHQKRGLLLCLYRITTAALSPKSNTLFTLKGTPALNASVINSQFKCADRRAFRDLVPVDDHSRNQHHLFKSKPAANNGPYTHKATWPEFLNCRAIPPHVLWWSYRLYSYFSKVLTFLAYYNCVLN